MIEQDETFPDDYGLDYCLLWINIDKYPAYKSKLDRDSGEILFDVVDNTTLYIHTLPILLDPNGINVVPANLYLHSLLSNFTITSPKTIESHALALLSFYRFLNLELPAHTDPRTGVLVEEKHRTTIYDCTDKIEESQVVKYRDYLLENIYTEDENGKIGGSPSTASNYVLKVVSYYTYLHSHQIVRCGKDFKPFEFHFVKIRAKSKNEQAQHDMLAHIKNSVGREFTVATTGLTKPFKNVPKPIGALNRELHPLREDEKLALYRMLDVENSTDTKDLMLYLATEVGVRLEELITFPMSVVEKPTAKVVKVQIGDAINGCLTKFKKNRTIEIPAKVMDLLFEYKLSKNRTKAIERSLQRHNRLFVQSNGNIYAPNTLQKYLEKVREELNLSMDIYFSMHDLRATFATDWLYNKHIQTGKPLDVLMPELADLMGHESTSTTQKYVNYMNNEKNWIEFAQRKNQFAQRVLE